MNPAPGIGARPRVLVAGWFSFEDMGATAGDFLACDVTRAWLREAGCTVDVAVMPPRTGEVDWRTVDPASYAAVVFVCGPFGNGWPVTDFLDRFRGRRLIGLNLSMLESLDNWNPFDLLLERDSSRAARPDVSLAARHPLVPVVGVVLVHAQKEYRGAMHETVNATIDRVLRARDAAAVRIDTRLDRNVTGLRSPAQVESVIARMDTVLTTRLHGLVLALKNGVPAVAIDPIAGGAKVRRQAETLGWPVLLGDELTDEALSVALNESLTEAARARARRCRDHAIERLQDVHKRLVTAARELRGPGG